MEGTDPKFLRHVTSRYSPTGHKPRLTELMRDAGQVRETVGTDGWAVLQHLLGDELLSIDRELERPEVIANHAHVARLLGLRAGLNATARAAQTLLIHETKVREEQAKRHEVTASGAVA